MRRLGLFAALVFCLQVTGCTKDMALIKGQTDVVTSGNSIVLMPVNISNKSNPGFTPYLIQAKITGAENQAVNLNVTPFKAVELDHDEYLLSFSLSPGQYTVSELSCMAKAGPFFVATCMVPLNAAITVNPNSVQYVGQVNTYVKDRTDDNESRAGGLFPILPQTTSGFFNGTFVTKIEDRYEEDIAKYRSEYPGLEKLKIEKAISPTPR
jgi:hypothetical protein